MTKVEMILAQVDGLLDAAYEVVNGRKYWYEEYIFIRKSKSE